MANDCAIKIIIVDDDKNSVNLLSKMAAKIDGIQIKATATNFEDGIREILFHKPDILLLDIIMPQKGGFDIIREIRYEI